ncbi:MAG: protein kinase [Gammaproteobacteria bacterium]|nr:protein kinase [Gammaproteobacteria bacterium]
MPLFLDIGHCEQAARRTASMGSCMVLVPEGRDGGHGVMLACAEGVPGRPEPQQAAKTAITALGDTYYAATSGSLQDALTNSVNAAHQALLTAGERGRAVTAAVLVLHGQRWLLANCGNVRAWLYRDLQLKQLSRDHLLPRPTQRAEITKALGLATTLEADYQTGQLAQGDILLITSPDLHEALSGSVIVGVLQSDSTAQQMSEALVQRAISGRAQGYVGVCVARIERLPPESANDGREDIRSFPVIDPPALDANVDGFTIQEIVHKSRRFRLYKAQDRESGRIVVLRFPNPSYHDDTRSVQTFLREEWIGKRIDSPFVVKTLGLRPGRRTALYSVMEYHEGENLAKRVRRKRGLPPLEALRLGEQLVSALEALHRQGVVHRDVRANNLLYDKNNRELRLLGLGSSRIDALQENSVEISTSAMSYCAPELFRDAPATEASDIYAAGVTIYRMISAEYPYGKIRAREEVGRQGYTPLSHYKAGLPNMLDEVLQRACANDPMDRYPNMSQFAAALIAARNALESIAKNKATEPERSNLPINWQLWTASISLLLLLLAYLYFVLR